jgi:hypothetical protein
MVGIVNQITHELQINQVQNKLLVKSKPIPTTAKRVLWLVQFIKTKNLMKEIAEELLKSIKFIPIQERKSKWYKEYLDKVNKDLKISLENES